jgi:hypothetical protein
MLQGILQCHSERSEETLIISVTRRTKTSPEMFESLASCFAFRCSASLNSPQDESAVADMTGPFGEMSCRYDL